MVYVVTDSVLDVGGGCELEVRVGSGDLDAVQGLGYGVGAYEVSLVVVGERLSVDA